MSATRALIPNPSDPETPRLPRGRIAAVRFPVPVAQTIPTVRNSLLSILRSWFGPQRRS